MPCPVPSVRHGAPLCPTGAADGSVTGGIASHADAPLRRAWQHGGCPRTVSDARTPIAGRTEYHARRCDTAGASAVEDALTLPFTPILAVHSNLFQSCGAHTIACATHFGGGRTTDQPAATRGPHALLWAGGGSRLPAAAPPTRQSGSAYGEAHGGNGARAVPFTLRSLRCLPPRHDPGARGIR